MSTRTKRYVGLDVHKHYVMVGAVDRAQQVLLPPCKVALVELEGWAQKYLQPSDEVVLEATTVGSGLCGTSLSVIGVVQGDVVLYRCYRQCLVRARPAKTAGGTSGGDPPAPH